MSRYIGPKKKIIKKLGNLPGFKIVKNINQNKNLKKTNYGKKLLEKQKLRYNYGISEIQLYNYIKKNYKNNKTPFNLRNIIETRLDSIIYRLGFAPSIPNARQLINHGKIYVNTKRLTIPSFKCKINDIIELINSNKHKEKNKNYFKNQKAYNFIKINPFKVQIKNIPIFKYPKLKCNERLIIEFYTKK